MSLHLPPNLDAWTFFNNDWTFFVYNESAIASQLLGRLDFFFFYNDWIFVIMSGVPTWTLAVKPLISLFHPLVPLLESRGRGRGGV